MFLTYNPDIILIIYSKGLKTNPHKILMCLYLFSVPVYVFIIEVYFIESTIMKLVA